MLLMEETPPLVLPDDHPAIRKASSLLCEEVVYLTMRQCVQVGKKEVNYLLVSGLSGPKKRYHNRPGNKERLIRVYYAELKIVVRGRKFASMCDGMGWPYREARGLLLANLEGQRLEESQKILDKVKYDGAKIYGTTGGYGAKARARRTDIGRADNAGS